MQRIVSVVVSSVILSYGTAFALDQPISGLKLQLRQLTSGKQKLIFQSKDPGFLFPTESTDAPTMVGATIELFSPTTPAGAALEAPAAGVVPGWTAKDGPVASYTFKRGKESLAVTSVKGIVIRAGRVLTVLADATGLDLSAPQGAVGIRIRTGTLRNCARFAGAAVVKDTVGAFIGKGATSAGLADCGNSTLSGQPPACGDGEANQPGEECDGTCQTDVGPFTCRPPGASNECTCCSDGGAYTQVVGCCNPSSILIPMPPASGGLCVATRCDPPDSCNGTDQCQADNTCCSVAGGNACVASQNPFGGGPYIPLNACCPGLACERPQMGGIGCCAAAGSSCASDGECCTGHCLPGGTCEACRTSGTACTSGMECCSRSCAGGTCNACRAPGTFCTSGASCCSNSCSASYQCD